MLLAGAKSAIMPPKPAAKAKAPGAPEDEPPSKRGGAGKNQGRKPNAKALGSGQKDVHGNVLPQMKTPSLASLLGARAPSAPAASIFRAGPFQTAAATL